MRALSLVIFLFLAGCAAWKPFAADETQASAPLPEHYLRYYDYPAGGIHAELVDKKQTRSYFLKTLEFPLRLPAELAVRNLAAFENQVETLSQTDQKTARDLKLRFTNRIDLYLPRDLAAGEKRPAVLISPILGGNMVVDRFAAYYAGRGMIAALVHRKRLLWEKEEGIEQVENYLRASVIRLRQAVDWLEAQPEVASDRIGSFGVSYGAILHSVLAAVEPRIRYHVLSMPAAPLYEVIIDCPDRAVTKLMTQAHEQNGWTEDEIRSMLKQTIVTDPMFLAPYIPRGKVQVYVAMFDRVVGAGRSLDLWRSMGKPELKLLPFGHYGGILVFPYLQTQSYRALKKHLK